MSTSLGKPVWFDLTVDNADQVRDFYAQVVGWSPAPVEMGDYNDYMMNTADGQTAAGICHRRGDNAAQPPQWMLYFTVADLDASLADCARLGGKVLVGPRGGGDAGRFAVIEDPAGAVCTLMQTG